MLERKLCSSWFDYIHTQEDEVIMIQESKSFTMAPVKTEITSESERANKFWTCDIDSQIAGVC